LLTKYHGTASTGIWAACFGIASLSNPLLFGVQNFLGPKIAHSYAEAGLEALRRLLFKGSVLYCLIVTPLCLALFFFGDNLLILVYGTRYGGNGAVISVMAINIFVTAAIFTVSSALLAMERSDLYCIANIVPLVSLLSLGIMLVMLFGPLGVAWGLLIGKTATAAVMILFFARLIKKTTVKNG